MICNKSRCTGCGLCVSICPTQCITLKPDEHGALKYSVDYKVCTSCGKCRKYCPSNRDCDFNPVISCYAGWAIDEDERISSSSGGIAALLYRKVLAAGGEIVGACFEGGRFFLKLSDSEEDIALFKGSKYVHCDGQNVYTKVQEKIKSGKPVLFVGTPCQVAAIKRLVGNTPLLYTVDLICHGTPPQQYFREHFKPEKNRIRSINFRDKGIIYRMKLETMSQKIRIINGGLDEYYLSFINGIIFNDCCYQCQYARTERVSDITIGDFWGIDPDFLKQEKVNKVSLVLANTPRGEDLLHSTPGLRLKARSLEEALPHNEQLLKPFSRSTDRIKFEQIYQRYGFDKTIHKLGIERVRRKNIVMTFLSGLARKIRRKRDYF